MRSPRQDYPNLETLFVLAGGTDDADGDPVADRILARLPNAFIRDLGANPGFGPAANAVLDVVEGDNGFFCICHDDVALDHDAIRLLIEELYRSNAGIIGPKLVSWDAPNVLQDVGLDVDAYGQAASRVEPGEYDQEQHDAVTDVFAVPSACLLTRADLFRSLGGFDPAMSFHGEDVDLCWRAHISGARVMVAPSARVRHRHELETRRPDLGHATLRARHRMRSTLTLTSGSRLPVRLLELIGVTLVEFVLGVFTGRVREGWASLRALVGAIPRFPTLLARRGAIAKIRRVGDSEIRELQSHGSNALRLFGRAPRVTVVHRRRGQRACLARALDRTGRHVGRRRRGGADREPHVHQRVGPGDRRVPAVPCEPRGHCGTVSRARGRPPASARRRRTRRATPCSRCRASPGSSTWGWD